jgi:hypothetical protein
MNRYFSLCAAALIASVFAATASAQPFSDQSSYANLYSWQLGTSGQPLTPQSYLWDRYYYNNPNVSPYLNLNRVQPYGGTDYFTYVQPMEQQRQREQMRSFGGPTSGGYYSAGAGSSSGSTTSPRIGASTYNPGAPVQGRTSYSQPFNNSSEIMPYSTSAPNRSASYYHNHYYGGWEGRN